MHIKLNIALSRLGILPYSREHVNMQHYSAVWYTKIMLNSLISKILMLVLAEENKPDGKNPDDLQPRPWAVIFRDWHSLASERCKSCLQ